MSHPQPAPLPLFDRRLLHIAERIVPAAEREEWSRTWQSELWHLHHGRRRPFGIMADLSIGLVRDALWLRTESWRRCFSGTTSLCLGALLGLCLFALVIALAIAGGWHSLRLQLCEQFSRFLVAAPLVVSVTYATGSRRHTDQSGASKPISWIRRQLFFASESALVLLLSFLLSVDACQPIRAVFLYTADLLQIFFFVVFAIIGLRWAFRDQEQRCEHCLCSLAAPARVGRPSHNLLEWNGTELSCKHGHGRLSIPEMETSWCQSSRWVNPETDWNQVASL